MVLAFVSRSVVTVSGVEAARWRPCQLVVMLLIGLQQFIGARGDGQAVIPGKIIQRGGDLFQLLDNGGGCREIDRNSWS